MRSQFSSSVYDAFVPVAKNCHKIFRVICEIRRNLSKSEVPSFGSAKKKKKMKKMILFLPEGTSCPWLPCKETSCNKLQIRPHIWFSLFIN